MYTHDRKIMRILVTAYLIEFIAVITLLMVAMVYGSNLTEGMPIISLIILVSMNK
jgi:hypothetical protein